MFTIAGGILLAVFILSLLPWIFLGAAWIVGIALVIAIAGGAVWAVWTGAQSVAGLAVELMIGAVCLIWLYFKMPPRASGSPNFVVRLLSGWVSKSEFDSSAASERYRTLRIAPVKCLRSALQSLRHQVPMLRQDPTKIRLHVCPFLHCVRPLCAKRCGLSLRRHHHLSRYKRMVSF